MSHNLYDAYFILQMIQTNLNLEICNNIFDKNISSHLWEKFLTSDQNIISFISRLDVINRKKLFEWAEKITNGDAKYSNRF